MKIIISFYRRTKDDTNIVPLRESCARFPKKTAGQYATGLLENPVRILV